MKHFVALGLVCLLSQGILFAEAFSFSADSMSSTRALGKERTVLSGNARIVSDSTIITADLIELYGTEYRYAVCSGNVVAIDEKKGLKLTTNKLFYDRTDKLSRLEGFSTLEDKRNKLVIKGGYIENDEKKDVAIIRIGVRVLKEDMACSSEYARYSRVDKVFELSGDPIVRWKGDEYRAEFITVNIETDEISMKGRVQGSLVKKEDAASPPPAAPIMNPETNDKPSPGNM
jgi:lipopolysaccharide export system protein LptA